MVAVEILSFQENIILRAGGSELLIQALHVKKLQDLKQSRDFSQYFRAEALVNRPARKLFEAWLRKDQTLWQRIYKTVHTDEKTGVGVTDTLSASSSFPSVEMPKELAPETPPQNTPNLPPSKDTSEAASSDEAPPKSKVTAKAKSPAKAKAAGSSLKDTPTEKISASETKPTKVKSVGGKSKATDDTVAKVSTKEPTKSKKKG